jgi:hypothetical protein
VTIIHAQVELYGAAEKRAFAKFLEESAKADDQRRKDCSPECNADGGTYAPVPPDIAEMAAASSVEVTEVTIGEAEPSVLRTTRKRGEPSPGKQRRTKAEIAEDDAAAAAESTTAEKPAISETPEDRQDPNNPDVTDDAETAAADAADEAAETAAASTGKLTLDHVRNASGAYAKKFGVAAAQSDLRNLMGKPMVELTEAEFESAAKAITDAVEANPFEREVVGAEPAKTEAKAAPVEKKDLIEVMLAYALKYDGQNTNTKEEAMPVTTEDVRKCLSMRFGAEIKALKELTPDQYPQVLTDLKSMLEKNPFKREAKVA